MCLAKGTEDEIADRCQWIVNRSNDHEVHIYEFKPTTKGQASYIPAGLMELNQVWQLWDATDEFNDDLNALVGKLDEHTTEGAKKYLTHMIERLQQTLADIQPQEPTREDQQQAG